MLYTGSTTKQFTAAAASLLIDDTANASDLLTWQTPLVSQIRDDFVLQDEYMTDHTTLEDALSHRTGLPRHDISWIGYNASIPDIVRKLRYLPPTAEPRTKFQYNNMMFIAVSHFIERFTQTKLGAFLKARIYEPLGMKNTFFSLADAKAASLTGRVSLANGYAWNNLTQDYERLAHMDFPGVAGAGATISTVMDYGIWIRSLINEAAPLSSAGHAALRYPRITRPSLFGGSKTGFEDFEMYSLGLTVSYYRGELLISHTGGLPGFATFMAFMPDRKWGAAIMANNLEGGVSLNNILMFKLIDDALGIPDAERYDWEQRERDNLSEEMDKLENARSITFPDCPDPPLSLSLPLAEHVGLYVHPGYPDINITLGTHKGHEKHGEGVVEREYLQSTSFYQLNDEVIYTYMEQVTGEFFFVRVRMYTDEVPLSGKYSPWLDITMKAEFKIGEDGTVLELGVLIEPEMGEEKIWFKRV
ncbi:MAG: hypothetical protein OHK93_005264 [Ramalina farinacea]|uniref:Beta-lactamase-related domain-containing protein n=1 Tax=Ramalina farinacea TaxID=258253 RepID=A0AA43QXM8_9LECA|nr:hypothetical protein [Ramalina farinacea]